MPDHGPLTHDDAERIAASLRLIADPARLQLLDVMFREGSSTGIELVLAIGRLSQPTVSHHVHMLIRGGLVEQRRDGIFMLSRLTPAGKAALKLVRSAEALR